MAKGIEIVVGAKDSNFQETMTKVNRSVDGMDRNVKRAGASVSASFKSMVKAGAALAIGFGAVKLAAAGLRKTMAGFTDAIDMGGRLNDLSARTGETAGKLLILERAFQNSGAGAEKVGPAINKMQRAIVEAGQGITTYKRAFDMLGVSLDDLKNMTPTEQLQLLAQRLASMPNDTERAAVAMQILGRSGGELIPLFRNFGSEIDRAGAELGSLPGIMDKSNATFDAIADKLAVIKGKFTEFAAGILNQILPALDLVTHALSRIDAAAIGMRLANAFVGGQQAMDGFKAALEAIKMGELKAGMRIVFDSLKLQVANTANAIFKNIKGAIAAILEFAKTGLGPGSGIWTIITSQIDLIGVRISTSIGKALLATIGEVPGIGKRVTETISANMRALEQEATNASARVRNALSQVPGDMIRATDAAKRAFEDARNAAGDVVDATEMEIALQKSKLVLMRKQAEEARKRADEAMKSGKIESDLTIKIGGQRVSNAERIAELETDIKNAKAQGNDQLVKELEAQKAYYKSLEDALGNGKTLQEAINAATKEYNSLVNTALVTEKAVTKEKAKQLGLSDKLMQQLKEARVNEAVDRSGKLQKRARREIELGQWKRAERTVERIKDKEREVELRGAGAKRDRRSIRDIAQEEGIDTFRKSRKQLRDEILRKRQQDLELGKAGKAEKEMAEERKKALQKKAKTPMDQLNDVVKDIRQLVAQIEPKLPQHALT